jgi:hypothetical protein
MALPAPIIAWTDGTNGPNNIANNASAQLSGGNQVTFALQSSTGVLVAEWVLQAPGTALDGQRFRVTGAPWSMTVPVPAGPYTLTVNTEVTDGNNISTATNTFAVQQSGSNWVMLGSTTTANQAGPASVFVAACLLQVRLSGLFHVDISVGWSDGTTGDTVTWTFLTDTSASGQIAGANKAAHGYSGVGALNNGLVSAGVLADAETMDGAGNLTYNGAAWNTAPITQKVEANPTLTGLLSGSAQKFVFSGVVANAAPTGIVKTPFTKGNTVGFGIKVSATNTITMPQIIMSVTELAGG